MAGYGKQTPKMGDSSKIPTPSFSRRVKKDVERGMPTPKSKGAGKKQVGDHIRRLIADYERLILEQGAKSFEDYRVWWSIRHELKRLLEMQEREAAQRVLNADFD